MVIALIVTPDGLPLMAGNTSDKTTLRGFLQRIEAQYGKAGRTWIMDRHPHPRSSPICVGGEDTRRTIWFSTSGGRLSQLEQDFLAKPWAQVREAVQVKLVEQDGELYVLARSSTKYPAGQRAGDSAAAGKKKLVKRLHELRQQKLTRDQLLIKLGAARKEVGPAVWRIIELRLPEKDQIVTPETFGFRPVMCRIAWALRRSSLRHAVGKIASETRFRHALA